MPPSTWTSPAGRSTTPRAISSGARSGSGRQPLLRRSATHEVVTAMPLERVVACVLSIAGVSSSNESGSGNDEK